MIKAIIYERYIENVGDVRGYLRKFANGSNIVVKENVFFKVEDMMETMADICLLDYKAFLEDEDGPEASEKLALYYHCIVNA